MKSHEQNYNFRKWGYKLSTKYWVRDSVFKVNSMEIDEGVYKAKLEFHRLINSYILMYKGAPNFQNNGVLITTKIFSSKNHYPNFVRITTKIFFSMNHYNHCPNFGLKIIKITTKSYLDKNHYLILPQSLKITMKLGPLVGPLGSNLGVR